MGTIVARPDKNGRNRYTARIVRKKGGKVIHTEADTFQNKRDAEIWIRRRETELDRPGGIELAKSPNPTLRVAIEKFIATNNTPLLKTQANLYETLKNSPLADKLCSEVRSPDIVAYAEKLGKERQPSTVGQYISALGAVFKIAKPAWSFQLDRTQWEDANVVLRRLKKIDYSNKRDRRPTLDELDALMSYFQERSIKFQKHGVAPMHRVVAYAIFSTRRLDEIIRQDRADIDFEHRELIVRQMKDPRNKTTNDVRCEMTEEVVAVAKALRIDPEDNRLFPYNYGQVQQGFSNGCKDVGIENLTFHDLRHEGISRLFEIGRTIPQVACVSGHKNWTSLKRYAHIRQSGDKFENWKWLPIVTAPQSFQIQP